MSRVLLQEVAEHFLISSEYFMKRQDGKWLLSAKVREDEEDAIIGATCAYIEALTRTEMCDKLSKDPKWTVEGSLEYANIDMSMYKEYREWWLWIETFVHVKRKINRAIKETKKQL